MHSTMLETYKFPVSSEVCHYLRRKLHDAAKDLRRRRRDTVYSPLSPEDKADFDMLEGLSAYFGWLKNKSGAEANLTEIQLQYLKTRLKRLYRILAGEEKI